MIEITNFIHGERAAPADGQTTELIDPSNGEVFANAALSREAERLDPVGQVLEVGLLHNQQ